MSARAPHGVLRSRDVPGGTDIRDEALERVLAKEEEAILAERAAELEAKKPALIESVKKAVEGVRFNAEIVECQHNLEDAERTVENARQALREARSDDDAARLAYKRARNFALREGLTEDELPTVEPPVAKTAAEGAWPSRWGRG